LQLGLEGIVSKAQGFTLSLWPLARLAQMKNPAAPAVKREAEEDWGKKGWP